MPLTLDSQLSTHPPRTTIVQMARLGDLAQAWPLTAALRSFSRVTLVVNSGLAPLARIMADEVIPVDLKRLLGGSKPSIESISSLQHLLSTTDADKVINLNFHPAIAAMAETIPAARRLGHRWKDVVERRPSDLITEELFQTSSGSRTSGRSLCDIWCDYAGARQPQLQPLKPTEEALVRANALLAAEGLQPGAKFTVLIVGAGLAGRILPVETWGMAAIAASQSSPVVLIGTAAEKALGKAVAQHTDVTNLVGKTDIETLTGILALAKLVVGVDTGALHVAAALGIPTVGIYYGSMGFRQTGPYGSGHIVMAPNQAGYPVPESALRYLSASALPQPDAVAELIATRLENRSFTPPPGLGVWTSKIGDRGIEWTN